MTMLPYGDNSIPAVPVDYKEHTPLNLFCWDETCPCHEKADEVSRVNQAYQEGLITAENATRIVRGKTI